MTDVAVDVIIKMKLECIEWEMNMFKIYRSKFNNKI